MKQYSVIVVGGGMVGLAFARALSMRDLSVAIVESKKPLLQWKADAFDARVSALNLASKRFLDNLSVWSLLREKALSPLRAMHVWDDVGGGEIHFDACEVGKPELGFIVENREIARALWQALQKDERVDFYCPNTPASFEKNPGGVALTLDDGAKLQADLLVGADGGHSWVREQMRVDVAVRPYEQEAVVAVIETEKSHQHTAYQSFHAQGPLGVLPLQNPYRSAIVWSTSPEHATHLLSCDKIHCAMEVSNALGLRLGKATLLSSPKKIPLVMRHAKQYVLDNVALIGDAAHTIHPLAGQGVNLGFMDAATLAEVLLNKKRSQSLGALRVLRQYERWRKSYNTMMLIGMRSFKEVFESDSPWLTQLRSLGFDFTDKNALLKKSFMRIAMGEQGDLPEVASVGK